MKRRPEQGKEVSGLNGVRFLRPQGAAARPSLSAGPGGCGRGTPPGEPHRAAELTGWVPGHAAGRGLAACCCWDAERWEQKGASSPSEVSAPRSLLEWQRWHAGDESFYGQMWFFRTWRLSAYNSWWRLCLSMKESVEWSIQRRAVLCCFWQHNSQPSSIPRLWELLVVQTATPTWRCTFFSDRLIIITDKNLCAVNAKIWLVGNCIAHAIPCKLRYEKYCFRLILFCLSLCF